MKRKSVYSTVICSSLILAFAGNLFGAFASNIQESFGLSINDISVILSLSQVGTFCAFILYQSFEKRFGPYRTMIGGLFGYSLGYFLTAWSSSGTAFAIAYILTCTLGYALGTAKSIVAVLCDREHQDRNIAAMHLFYSIASISMGMLVTRIKGPYWKQTYLVFAFIWLALAFYTILLDKRARNTPELMVSQKTGRFSLKDFSLLAKPSSLAFFVYVMLSAAVEGLAVIYPLLFIQYDLGADNTGVGLALSCYFAGMTLARLLLVPVFSRSRHKWMTSALFVSLAAASFLLLAFSRSLTMAFVSMFINGFATGDINPMANILEVHIWKDDVEQWMNLHCIAPTIGRLFLPLIVSAFITNYSQRAGIVSLSVMMALSALFLAISYKTRPQPRP